MSKFGIEPLTPRMREASERLYERCMEVSKELAPIIDEACGGDQRKLWNVIGSTHWGIAFVALAMMHPNEDEFVRAMKSQPLGESELRAKHRELHGKYAEECGAVFDIPRARETTVPASCRGRGLLHSAAVASLSRAM